MRRLRISTAGAHLGFVEETKGNDLSIKPAETLELGVAEDFGHFLRGFLGKPLPFLSGHTREDQTGQETWESVRVLRPGDRRYLVALRDAIHRSSEKIGGEAVRAEIEDM